MTTAQALEQADLLTFFLHDDREATTQPDHDYGYHADSSTGVCDYCGERH